MSASSRTFQRKGKGLLLQWLVLLPELPPGQLFSDSRTSAAQLGHQQTQGANSYSSLIAAVTFPISIEYYEPQRSIQASVKPIKPGPQHCYSLHLNVHQDNVPLR